MTEIVKQQILAIRATAETNMFDAYAVQYIANREGFYELVVFIQEHDNDHPCKKAVVIY